MKNFFLALQAQLQSSIAGIYCRMWNSQDKELEKGTNYSWTFPAVFIEFIDPRPKQLPINVQIYDPFIIRFHIANQVLNTDGQEDQNLQIFDFEAQVFAALQRFKTNYASVLTRTAQKPPVNHNNVAWYEVDYTCTLFDNTLQTPQNPIQKAPPTALELDIDVDKAGT